MAIGLSKEGMLAGVCSRLAARMGWNVWAIRAVLLILLVAEPLFTALGYALAAFVISALERRRSTSALGDTGKANNAGNLESPELASRKQRIADLEQRFRKWEQSLDKD